MSRFGSNSKGPAQQGQLSIDARIASALALPLLLIFLYFCGRYFNLSHITEEWLQMSESHPQHTDGALLINLVIANHASPKREKRESVLPNSGELTNLDFREPLGKEPLSDSLACRMRTFAYFAAMSVIGNPLNSPFAASEYSSCTTHGLSFCSLC